VVTEERDVSGFDSVFVSGMGKVIVTQGNEESLTIETDDNLMQYIETKVSAGRLELGFSDDVKFSEDGRGKVIDPSDSIIFHLSLIDLSQINISGAASFEIQELDADRFEIVLGGAGDVRIDSLSATDLVVEVSGAGDIDLAGQVETQDISLDGLGNYDAFDLESQGATVQISGAGSANIWVRDTLNVKISGAGDVDYYGNPSLTESITGAGSINREGDK
jgi:hypothetical protein